MKIRKIKILEMLNIENNTDNDIDSNIDSYNDETIYALRENVNNDDNNNIISTDMQKFLDLMG